MYASIYAYMVKKFYEGPEGATHAHRSIRRAKEKEKVRKMDSWAVALFSFNIFCTAFYLPKKKKNCCTALLLKFFLVVLACQFHL
jgi:hypothetical protein